MQPSRWFLAESLLLLAATLSTTAKVVEHTFDIGWVWANPDGRHERPVIGVNHVWPPPTIHVDIGDRLIVHAVNSLGNETTALHWHGIYQNGTAAMDGPSMVVQCPIPPGYTFTYNFTIDQPGSYWYHSHDSGQYPDGLRGALIVHDPHAPFADQIDGELVLTFSDWYHDQMPYLISKYLSVKETPDGAEPVPYSALLNDLPSGQAALTVEPDKTYLLRFVSLAAFAQAYVWIDSHDMEIVETDGIYIEPTKVGSVYLATGQRYSVLLRSKTAANGGANTAYRITAMMDTDDFDDVPAFVKQNTTAYLFYEPATVERDAVAGFASTEDTVYIPPQHVTVADLNVVDEFDLVPADRMPALTGTPDVSFVMNLSFFTAHEQNRAGFNNISYFAQKVPTLYSILSAPDTEVATLNNASVYGKHTNAMVAQHGDLVEIVINNFDDGAHIMHIHGHAVQLVAKVANVTDFGGTGTAKPWDGETKAFPKYPDRRDTWILAPNGYTVIRFIASNPGVWLMHCHMEWHVDAGLTATFISAPETVRATQSLNPQMVEICKAGGIAVAGNAAANVEDYHDLHGQVTVPNPVQLGAFVSGP